MSATWTPCNEGLWHVRFERRLSGNLILKATDSARPKGEVPSQKERPVTPDDLVVARSLAFRCLSVQPCQERLNRRSLGVPCRINGEMRFHLDGLVEPEHRTKLTFG